MNPTKELEKKYDNISNILWQSWKHRNLKYNDRLHEFYQLLKPNSKLLDFGCGFGRDVHFFNELGIESIGIDISHEMVNLGLKKYGSLNLVCGDIFKASEIFQSKFDAIWCRGVLFHFNIDLVKKIYKEIEYLTFKGAMVYIQINKDTKSKRYKNISDSSEKAMYYYHSHCEINEIFNQSFELKKDLSNQNYLCLIYERK
ncbi:class I SAM-dependent methyltransferase [Sunxiuqinia elliptica]|uniref:Methyltransferase domain-containing protein n=1 Tax=Sunxiuqinia elliptica TaxID=655355 RepID=A0A1I2MHU6_9BACT|nr:class I SAM-dependent methyltransferase [Sunxiuqinia elliptica]SFF90500.1 Methyltransferase domain-containing protein [Sunxiuqinia elliptica]